MGSDKDSIKVNAMALYDLLKLMRSSFGKDIRAEIKGRLPTDTAYANDAVNLLSDQYNAWAKMMAPPILVDAACSKSECSHQWAYDEKGPNYEELRNANFCVKCGMHKSFTERPNYRIPDDLKTFVETGGLTRDQLSDGLKEEMEQTEPSTGTGSTAGPQCGHAPWCASHQYNGQYCNCLNSPSR